MRYGQGFQKPSRAVLRKARAEAGPRMFEREQAHAMLAAASTPVRAMILLGVNAGLGNSDCAALRLSHLDLELGWMDYPRPKTGVARRARLWPETVSALREAIAIRPKPKDAAHAELVFVTSRLKSWAKDKADNPISKETAKLLKSLGLHAPGLNFYSLRRTFETIGGGSRDQVAVDHVMGHAPGASDMAAVYRQRIDDQRLEAVASHVHDWLWPAESKDQGTTSKARRRAGAPIPTRSNACSYESTVTGTSDRRESSNPRTAGASSAIRGGPLPWLAVRLRACAAGPNPATCPVSVRSRPCERCGRKVPSPTRRP